MGIFVKLKLFWGVFCTICDARDYCSFFIYVAMFVCWIWFRVFVVWLPTAAPGISASPSEDNMRYFNVMILGPTQSPYEGSMICCLIYVIRGNCLFRLEIWNEFLYKLCFYALHWDPRGFILHDYIFKYCSLWNHDFLLLWNFRFITQFIA